MRPTDPRREARFALLIGSGSRRQLRSHRTRTMLTSRPVEAAQVEPVVSANKHTKTTKSRRNRGGETRQIGIATEVLTPLTRERGEERAARGLSAASPRDLHASSWSLRKARTALWPPNPKLLLSATSLESSRARLGMQSRSHCGSGVS